MQSEKCHLLFLIYKIKQMTYEGMDFFSSSCETFIFYKFVLMQKLPDDGNG